MERSEQFEIGGNELQIYRPDDGGDSEQASVKQKIDLERLIWDPDYRAWAKEQIGGIG